MRHLTLVVIAFATIVTCVRDATARSLRSGKAHREKLRGGAVLHSSKNSVNSTKPRGVFLFDDNCMWYLHGKGQLIAKINCVNPKKRPPVIVARRRNGKMHFKLQRNDQKKPWRPSDKKERRIVKPKGGQIPLKCYYRYDEKGVFYLTTCYTHSRQFGAIEMNFRGHRPGEKSGRGERKHWRKRGKRRRKHGSRPRRGRRIRRKNRRRNKLRRLNRLNHFLTRTIKDKSQNRKRPIHSAISVARNRRKLKRKHDKGKQRNHQKHGLKA